METLSSNVNKDNLGTVHAAELRWPHWPKGSEFGQVYNKTQAFAAKAEESGFQFQFY